MKFRSSLILFFSLFILLGCSDNDEYDTTADTVFLEENATRPDVVVTDSGLQYKVIEEGSGDTPEESSSVLVNYEGRLVSGEVFDSSYERGEPTIFRVNGLISGFTEGLQLMQEGATYELYIPKNLAYGSRPPANSIIPPNAALIFKVELLEVL